MINLEDFDIVYASDQQEWRDWLQNNHDKKESIWLVYYKKKSKKPSVVYTDAVDEALCFGWIDSKTKSIDDEKYFQFFCPRKPKSVWSKVNKEKISRLIEAGKMTAAGYAALELAKENGSWATLDEVEALIIPDDLELAFESQPTAKSFFLSLSKSDKRNILQWLVLAKRPETRLKRITEIVDLASNKKKPKQF